MANEVKIKIKIDDNGDLTIIAKDAKKAAGAVDDLGEATEKAGKKRGKFHKGEKGVAGLTSNSTKGFAKQAQTINGGSSSLVGAYATLAANVFALSAAFNFFKRAADVSNLQKSQLEYASSTGTALGSMTQKLRDASGGMLGFGEAAEATAIGVAKGFSPQMMNKIAEGARKASTALGRDFGDSFDRLVRGISKAEPELLDELGITLRLKTATEEYAKSIDSTADALTASQRSMAVYNETMNQIEDNFGSVLPKDNAFILLQKTMDDIVRIGTGFILPFFEGFASIISRNGIAAVAIFGLIAISIFKMMVPLDGVKSRFKGMVDANISELSKLDDELEEISNTLKSIGDAKIDVKSAATAAGGAGSKSKLMQKAAKGDLTDPKQIGQLEKTLKARIAAGDKYTGVLKDQTVEQSKAVLKALEIQKKKTKEGIDKKIGFWKKWGLRSKKVIKKTESAYLKMTRKIGKAAQKMGKHLKTAMRIGGIIGIVVMIIETFMKLRESIGDMAVTAKNVAEKIISFYLKMVNKVSGAINALTKGVVGGLAGGFEILMTSIITLVNKAIGMINLIPGVNLELLDEDKFKGVGDRAAAAAPQIAMFNEEFKFPEDGAVARLVAKTKAIQANGEAAQRSKELMKEFSKTSKQMGIDATATAKQLEKMPNASEVNKGKIRSKSVQTLGVGGQVAEIARNVKNDKLANPGLLGFGAKTAEENGAQAIAKLRASMKDLADINPLVAATLNDNSISLDTMAERLMAFDEAGGNATAGSAALKDSLKSLPEAMSGGDILSLSKALAAVTGAANQASSGFTKLGETANALAIEEQVEDFRQLEIAVNGVLQKEHELFLLKQSQVLIAGKQGELRAAETTLMNAQNDALGKRILLEAALAEKSGASAKEIEDAQKASTAADAVLDQATVADVTAKQGAGAGAMTAAGLIGEGTFEKDKDGNNIPGTYEKGSGMDETTFKDLGKTADFISPMAEELAKLGPEGEYMSGALMGALQLGESLQDAFKSGGISAQEGLAIAGQAANAMGSIFAAQGKAKAAGVDKEIAAEKKRDGKSKESLAKIKALEKKKEEIKKKAFEKEKKAKMAGVLISTATAIMKESEKGFPAAIPGIAMFAAMGAMQLSTIASQKYEGGTGSVGETGAKSDVSMGDRNNKVDMAKSRSSVGELGYARGGSGVGNMSNFKPAFTGARYRAAGGSAGYIVGEQGPELFMPDVPGNIVSAGDTESMGGGGSTNLNFTINTIDSQGVQDVLSGQTGNIIKMIRDQANDAGETFLEGLDERY